ncbi:hypothetical protein THRCLA_02035 [Thraustotheca clavata]|uniref:Mitochondrial protein n=1 Tax=Thraustotheca clavata TaxID=74557 RepID=A0A1W0A6H2_9STRA|nr:hypothetical protein THRCLA_02035 [Thraustotheca clavata]
MLARQWTSLPRLMRGMSSLADRVQASWSSLQQSTKKPSMEEYARVWYDSLQAQEPEVTHQVWSCMNERFPEELSMDMFEATASALLGHDDFAVIDLFETQQNQRPEHLTERFYDIAIRAYCSVNKVDEAFELMKNLPNANMYMKSRILYAYARQGNRESCDLVLNDLNQSSSQWTSKGCDNVLRALGTLYPIESLFDFYQKMLQEGILPSPISVRILLQACINDAKMEHLERLLDNIPQLQLPSHPQLIQAQIVGHLALGRGYDKILLLTQALVKDFPDDEKTVPALLKIFHQAIEDNAFAPAIDLLLQLEHFPIPLGPTYKLFQNLPQDDKDLWQRALPLFPIALRRGDIPGHFCVLPLQACVSMEEYEDVIVHFHNIVTSGVKPNKTLLRLVTLSCKSIPNASQSMRKMTTKSLEMLLEIWPEGVQANLIESSYLLSLAVFSKAPSSTILSILEKASEWDSKLVSSALTALGQVQDIENLHQVYTAAFERGATDAKVETQYTRLLVRLGKDKAPQYLALTLPKARIPTPLLEEVLLNLIAYKRYKLVTHLLPQVQTRPKTFVKVFQRALKQTKSPTWLTPLYELAMKQSELPQADMDKYNQLVKRREE